MKHEEAITQKIISAIESGQSTHTMPWHSVRMPINVQTGKPYQGVNALILWAESLEAGYTSPHWASFLTWKALGRNIKKGSKGTRITYWHFYSPEEKEMLPPEAKSKIGFRRFYIVFNEAQASESDEPVDASLMIEERPDNSGTSASESVISILNSAGAELIIDGDRAFYNPDNDVIYMPSQSLFQNTIYRNKDLGFAGVLAHELVHWTGHESRLNRKKGDKDSADYAFEELVAELGSAFICSEIDIAYTGIPENAGYIENWLQRLRDDPKAIFRASSLAMKAKTLLLPVTQEDETLVT